MSDRIEKSIEIKAPVSRVWRALTDHKEFGTWFLAKLDRPFVVGKPVGFESTNPGCERFKWEVVVQKMEPERLFSFAWHPYAIDPKQDYSKEQPTLVEFTLEGIAGGTLLRVVESGFDKIPQQRRLEAFRMNEGGWSGQMQNIARYAEHVAQQPAGA
jgi:uncharacterized protein YndB with AHSA1/START domain